MKSVSVLTASVLAAAVLLTLAGCDAATAPAATPSTASAEQAIQEAARCMRAHGYPNWPDPVRNDDGNWVFPDSAPVVAAPPAECEGLLRTSKGGGRGPSRPPLSPTQMAQARTWAQCIREHGVPDWPDPGGDGTFTPPPQLLPLEGNSRYDDAVRACQSVEPPDAIRLPPQSGGGPKR